MTLDEYIDHCRALLPLCDGDESREWLERVIEGLEWLRAEQIVSQ